MENKIGFYKGYLVEVVATTEVQRNLIGKVVEDYNLKPEPTHIGQEWMIKPLELQRLAYDVHPLGSKVRYKNGSMIGTVVGYELNTNRCVVMSEKIDKYENNRTRYVYTPDELVRHIPGAIRLEIGRWYKVNGSKLFAVDSVFNPGEQLFLFTEAGTVAYSDLPRETTLSALRHDHGIASIKPL